MNFMPARLTLIPAQRASGRLALSFRRHGPVTRIDEFYQQGCLKTRLPRPAHPAMLDAVTLNISGGIAGGDSLATTITAHANAAATIASQAAERLYRALEATPAQITTTITLAPGATLHHLPQETILFDGFALNRTLDIHLDETASYLGVELLVFGRQAMRETVKSGHLRDKIKLYRNKKLIFQDMTRLDGDIAGQLARKAVADGAIATASLILAAPNAANTLPALREALGNAHAGASALDGNLIFARILAPSAISLRNCVVAVLAACRGGRPLPRVWQG
jgi:urease accessory protein